MASWRDQLQAAAFRGVPFHVERDSVPVGRAIQLHEYPKTDANLAEDMGRIARVHSFTAWVIGEDCHAKRDKLLDALEKPGAGELIHPWLGRMQAKAGKCEMSHDRREGGMVRFDLEFYPDTTKTQPVARANTARQLQAANQSSWAAALSRYRQVVALLDMGRANLRALRGGLSGVYAAINRHITPLAALFSDSGAFAAALMASPSSLASLLESSLADAGGAFDRVSTGSSSASARAASGGFDDYSVSLTTAADLATTAVSLPVATAAGGATTASLAQSVTELTQAALLYQAGRALSAVPVPPLVDAADIAPALDVQQIAPPVRAPVPVVDDVLAVRDQVSAALWQTAQRADAVQFVAINDTRQRVARHLAQVAGQSFNLVTVTPGQSLPALVLAYQLYGDATRSGEIVERNHQAHPGFLPAAPLQVLRGGNGKR